MLVETDYRLPIAESEPQFDWALFSTQCGSIHRLWFAYAAQRDFLSVPRSYPIIEFSAQQMPLELLQLETADYLAQTGLSVLPDEPGFYQWAGEPQRLVFCTGERVVEIVFEAIQLHPSEYHHENAQRALLAFLA